MMEEVKAAKSTALPLIFKGLALVLALFLFLGAAVMPRYTTIYNAAILDKLARLEGLDGPRLILVGDSNVAFGFNSAALEAECGLPVVNFGLHGALGQSFYTDMLLPYLHEGDFIVLLPESYDYANAGIPDSVMAWTTLENHAALWRGMRLQNLPGMAAAFPGYIRRALDLWLLGAGNGDYGDIMFKREYFNEYGDFAYPRKGTLNPESLADAAFHSGPLSPAMAAYWNAYHGKAAKKGASVLMGCPPVYENAATPDLEAVQASLEAGLNFPVVSRLAGHVYSEALFYDTGFHLNDEGAALRTRRLAEDLAPFLP